MPGLIARERTGFNAKYYWENSDDTSNSSEPKSEPTSSEEYPEAVLQNIILENTPRKRNSESKGKYELPSNPIKRSSPSLDLGRRNPRLSDKFEIPPDPLSFRNIGNRRVLN